MKYVNITRLLYVTVPFYHTAEMQFMRLFNTIKKYQHDDEKSNVPDVTTICP